MSEEARFHIEQRTHDLIRSGVDPTAARRLGAVLGETAALSIVGIAIGMLGALMAPQLLSSFMFGVTARDPLSLGLAALLLLLTSLIAGYVPARRAAGVDPVRALRAE